MFFTWLFPIIGFVGVYKCYPSLFIVENYFYIIAQSLPAGASLQLVPQYFQTLYFQINSLPLRSCHIKREKQHKVFKGIAQKGQCSLGWFYGFKLHIIINDRGEILDFIITPGNVNDRKPLNDMDLHKRIFGKLYGDKGYISKDLFEKLFVDGVHLITKIKKNMKNSLMLLQDKIALRKRALIETVNDELKNICQIEHTRHRSFENFTTNLLSGLIAYSFFDKKPSINLQEDIIDMKRIAA